MRATSRAAVATAILGASINMLTVPTRVLELRPNNAPGSSAMPFDILRLGAGIGSPGFARPNYIKRPRWTVARDKRRALKARNVRRHKLAIKRRGRK